MDWNSDEGKKLAGRLRSEQVIWLTTVRPNGMPSPTPVWFYWGGEDTIIIYTQPASAKMKNLAANSKAALNLNSDEWGGNVTILTGEIRVEPANPPPAEQAAYLDKYREGIKDINMTPESFAQDYSTLLRFHIQRVRGW